LTIDLSLYIIYKPFYAICGESAMTIAGSRIVQTGLAARFAVGDDVEVLRHPAPGHIRTPKYVQGMHGRISGVLGSFPNPEEGARGVRTPTPVPLYLVEIPLRSLWNGDGGNDVLEIELYEHWIARHDSRAISA
jgi:nitrile hydratase